MFRSSLVIVIAAGVMCASCHHKKYDNPITKNTQQPDKVLFDKAITDIEHGRYEVARITLNTLINTYDQSEFLAKAKLAIADSWYREGGAHGLAQAEAEYKDFILFYPTMGEAAESQHKICDIHYRQMEKADRDPSQALRAEDECRQLLVQFPNSKYTADTQQMLRNIQEALADGEYRVGDFYHRKGSNPAAANRFSRLVDQYPLYSRADDALWEMADSYSRMGPRFQKKAAEAYAKIVREYPLSDRVDESKKRLKDLEQPIPEADPVAYARMKYDQDHRSRTGMISRSTSFLKRGPDTSTAARNGDPAMTTIRPTAPASVPVPAAPPTGVTDVTGTQVTDPTALETLPDARQAQPSSATAAKPDATGTASRGKTAVDTATTPAGQTLNPAATTQPAEPLPQNANYTAKKKKLSKKEQAKQAQQAQQLMQLQQKQQQQDQQAPPIIDATTKK